MNFKLISTDIIFEMKELLKFHLNKYHKLITFDNSRKFVC